MTHLDLILEVLTPAFLSGADQHRLELRAPSIKGLLRWWWRAAEGHRFPELEKFAAEEAQLFGSAAAKLKSPFQIRVEFLSRRYSFIPRGREAPRSTADYPYRRRGTDGKVVEGRAQALHYLGYGPIRLPSKQELAAAEQGRDPALLRRDGRPQRGVLYARPALLPGTRFKVRIAWRDGCLTSHQQEELARAFAGLLVLGGVGSRSRKGFGSLHLAEPVKASSVDLAQRVTSVLQESMGSFLQSGDPLPTTLPRWPQLRYRQILHRTTPKDTWEEALGALAVEYRRLRPRVKDRDRRFICGDAAPRRASSVLLAVNRLADGFIGTMVALPCWRDDRSEERQAWLSFLPGGPQGSGQRHRDSHST